MSALSFPARLRELRETAGLTQGQLAERAGVQRGAVARWELGTREPSWSNVVALAGALGVDCNAFLEAPAAWSVHYKAARGRPRKASPARQTPAGGAGEPAPAGTYPATDFFDRWVCRVISMLTSLKHNHGGIASWLERREEWYTPHVPGIRQQLDVVASDLDDIRSALRRAFPDKPRGRKRKDP
jgi:DNA-binding XRE family transcriptional regulator